MNRKPIAPGRLDAHLSRILPSSEDPLEVLRLCSFIRFRDLGCQFNFQTCDVLGPRLPNKCPGFDSEAPPLYNNNVDVLQF